MELEGNAESVIAVGYVRPHHCLNYDHITLTAYQAYI